MFKLKKKLKSDGIIPEYLNCEFTTGSVNFTMIEYDPHHKYYYRDEHNDGVRREFKYDKKYIDNQIRNGNWKIVK